MKGKGNREDMKSGRDWLSAVNARISPNRDLLLAFMYSSFGLLEFVILQ